MNHLKIYREKAGISQTALAKASGCSQPTISAIEDADSTPNVTLAQRIVAALHRHGAECRLVDVFPPSELQQCHG